MQTFVAVQVVEHAWFAAATIECTPDTTCFVAFKNVHE
jgi:hypothetical protein